MAKIIKPLLAIFLTFSCIFCTVGYAVVVDTLDITGSAETYLQDGVFISRTELIDSSDINLTNTNVNKVFGTTMDSTVELSGTNGYSYATYEVTFFNNSNTTYVYDAVQYLSEAYDNASIVFETDPASIFIDAKEHLTINITFKYEGNAVAAETVLNSSLNFSFNLLESRNTFVDGNSADNLDAIADGNTDYDGSDTQNRWTNWTSTTAGRGESATINIQFTEETTIDAVKLYHFIDANQNANRYGSCDFPEAVSIYYYVENSETGEGEYVELTNYTTSKNYSNEQRRASDGVYQMTITNDDGTTENVTFTHNYSSTPPITALSFGESITTRGIQVVLDAKDNFFVGLMELELLDENGESILTN